MLIKAKLAYRKLQKESYGDSWTRQLKDLEGNEEAIQKLREQQRFDFNAKLTAMLLLKAGKPKITNLLEIETDVDEITDKQIDVFCAEWVKKEIDEAAWKALSEKGRQKLILQVRD